MSEPELLPPGQIRKMREAWNRMADLVLGFYLVLHCNVNSAPQKYWGSMLSHLLLQEV